MVTGLFCLVYGFKQEKMVLDYERLTSTHAQTIPLFPNGLQRQPKYRHLALSNKKIPACPIPAYSFE